MGINIINVVLYLNHLHVILLYEQIFKARLTKLFYNILKFDQHKLETLLNNELYSWVKFFMIWFKKARSNSWFNFLYCL